MQELVKTTKFKTMNKEDDELEHSIEMQLPFIKTLVPEVQIVPIYVGLVD